MFDRLGILLGLLLLTTHSSAPAADWPQWRGISRDGSVPPASTPWPDSLGDDALQELWKLDLAPSYSTPIVKGDRVFVTETREAKYEVVQALDRATGRQIWEASWEGALTVPFFAASNGSWIRSTPACDDEHLYVAGMVDVLVCLSQADGREKWRVDFVKEFGAPQPAFGFVSSPLILGDAIYVQAGGGFCKLNKQTGEVVWKVLDDGGGMWGSAFSSPYAAVIADQLQILVQTRTNLAGVDPETGKVLWSVEIPAFRGMNIVTPAVYKDAVLTSTYGGKTLLTRPVRNGEEWTTENVWTNKLQGYMSTPIIRGNHAFLHLKNQRFACVDLDKGEETWITKPYGGYWSLVVQGDRLLALDERGDLLLIALDSEEFRLLDSRHISDDSTWAHLVVVDDEVFVRSLKGLKAYRWKAQ